MKRCVGITFAGALLAMGLWSLTAYSADEDEDKKANKEAQEAVLKLIGSMNGNKGNVQGQAKAIHKKFDELKPVMWVYKPRKKGGIGFGKDGDDIEVMIGKVGNPRAKGMTPKKILAMREDFAKAAELSRAVAAVADLYDSQYVDNTGKKNPAKWKEIMAQMHKGADELSKAAKGNDAAKIQKAAGNLSASCTECHSVFR
jgi:hypothetical protein